MGANIYLLYLVGARSSRPQNHNGVGARSSRPQNHNGAGEPRPYKNQISLYQISAHHHKLRQQLPNSPIYYRFILNFYFCHTSI